LKVLDRYIVREFLYPIVYSCVALVFLILIADLFDNLDELLRHKIPVTVIAKYYLCLIPFAFSQIIPWATWLGTIFLLVSFGFHNETTAMKAVGLKITTIIKPIIFVGFLIGIGVFLVNDKVVPGSQRMANDLREIYFGDRQQKKEEQVTHNVTYFSGKDQLYYFRTFSRAENTVQDAIVLWVGDEPGAARKKMIAKHGLWNGTHWEFMGVTEYPMDLRGRILGEPRTYGKKGYPEMKFTPAELSAASSDSLFLSYQELKKHIRKLKENGVGVHTENVDLQARLAAPWQGLVMILISVPFLARTTNRKLIAFNVLICVIMAFSFHVSGAVGMALGKAGKIFPFLGAWFGNILFAVGALVYLDRANY